MSPEKNPESIESQLAFQKEHMRGKGFHIDAEEMRLIEHGLTSVWNRSIESKQIIIDELLQKIWTLRAHARQHNHEQYKIEIL